MSPIIIYALKANIAIALFYAFYRLLFYKDTFFHWRRVTLITLLIVSFLYPYVNIQDWMMERPPMVTMADMYAEAVYLDAINVVSEAEATAISTKALITTAFKLLYWGIAALLFMRFMGQLMGIIKLRMRSKSQYIGNTKVYLLSQPTGPFSFFKWIFINPQMHVSKETEEILTHELTHARQWHSLDVIFSELMCIICWFNPFVWLMKREIRSNLEYLADNKVLETGHDSKAYQYHLLGLANEKPVATLYNNFNVLPLKKRIKMMNKRRTKKIGRAKYFVFPILAMALLLVSNIEAMAQAVKKAEEPTVVVVAFKTSETPDTPTVFAKGMDAPKIPEGLNPPTFPEGKEAFVKHLGSKIKYPTNAVDNNEQGMVRVGFTVAEDGTVTDPNILQSVSPALDAEALRVVKDFPKWTPGTNEDGKAVTMKYSIAISFALADNKPEPVTEEIGEDDVYDLVETMPEFKEGLQALVKYLSENIVYPEEAAKEKIEGRVFIAFIVGTDGSVEDARVTRSVHPLLDAEALRVVSGMPKWTPGMQGGEKVRVKYTLPVVFRTKVSSPTPANT